MHEVREFAGHADIRTTEVYFVRKEEDAEVAARRIQIRLTGRKSECAHDGVRPGKRADFAKAVPSEVTYERGSYGGYPKLPRLAGLTMMNIALTDDLQRLVRKKVENGQFPDEEAVVREALRTYLMGEPQGRTPTGTAVLHQDRRTPGPFIEDETVLPPMTLPRPGSEFACSYRLDATRLPDRFPGE
jgi:Arc/MetJ-type ribon-helix-helix transcriptional regulator